MKYKIGNRVHIEGHWNFPNDCTGTISKPPKLAAHHAADHASWRGARRVVKGKKGSIVFYWVKFDTPQIDNDGDGPYAEAEVEAEYIELIDLE
ncbi:hypothetical protein [Candidatus Thiodiazotropha sp. CDECU1]|uniref:hypothetical protein n=1 Tax=Candidatus Thiodiazotropha sp. CDECU1 TaxID=3065865 RepID=UPI002931369B|nr:hypothetical protein [Candidatus Thiodiazotropha sp. CDECU1]